MKFLYFVLIFFLTQLNAKYLTSYHARLGEVDHYKNGKRLKSIADIIAQDRYNYHVKKIWQGYEDSWDPYFDKQSNRDLIKKLIKAGCLITPKEKNAIINGTPIVLVSIFSDHINVMVRPWTIKDSVKSKFIVQYNAKLARIDHYKNGKRLKSVADIIAQDRYNYHVKKIRQKSDEYEPYFKQQKYRKMIKKIIKNSTIDSKSKKSIIFGTPTISVKVYTDHMKIKLSRRK